MSDIVSNVCTCARVCLTLSTASGSIHAKSLSQSKTTRTINSTAWRSSKRKPPQPISVITMSHQPHCTSATTPSLERLSFWPPVHSRASCGRLRRWWEWLWGGGEGGKRSMLRAQWMRDSRRPSTAQLKRQPMKSGKLKIARFAGADQLAVVRQTASLSSDDGSSATDAGWGRVREVE